MHNLPTNNETNIIRNIFNVSAQLNESKSLKEATNPTYGERVSQAANETGGYVDPRAVEFSPEEQEDWSRKAKMSGTNINVIRAEEINKAADKARQDKRAKEAEESKARVKAWQSSPQYQKEVEADRAKAAAKKSAQQAANVVSQREQPESTAAKVDAAITTATTAVGLPNVISGALGIDAASRREAALAAEGEKARKHYETETSKPEYIARQTEDPRMLPQLVAQGKISQEEAEKKLEQHLKLRGGHDDISQHTEKRLKDLRATPPAPAPAVEPYKKNQNTLVKSAFEDIYSDLKRGWNWLTGNKTEMKESYYHRLANLFEETSDQPISGVNPAAYGYTPKGQRKARLAAKGFAEPMKSWAGDSTVEAPDLEPESTERPHIDTVVAPHIETLVRAAAQNELDLSHGEAFDPRSKDHQRLIIKTKDPEVMKASEAIRQIRKDYGMED
jgi:hypothetical protein